MIKYYKPKPKNEKALKTYLNDDKYDNKRDRAGSNSKRDHVKRSHVH